MGGDKIGEIKHLLGRVRALKSVSNCNDFSALALDIFNFQYASNPTYSQFVRQLKIFPHQVKSLPEIPLLPISAFKFQDITCWKGNPQTYFLSSGTTGQIRSKHLVFDEKFYHENCRTCFETTLKIPIKETCFLALLPSYLEQKHSSLVSMVNHFINISKQPGSSFYLYEHEALYTQLLYNRVHKIRTVLFGVSFALFDFVEHFSVDFPELVVIETGGMKGRGEELVRDELHRRLRKGFNGVITSEYGMTELFSQAYMIQPFLFKAGPTMAARVVERDDPLASAQLGKSGLLGLIDLANLYTCSFILTEDIGVEHDRNLFEILGRSDHSEWRGCNLLLMDIGG